MGKVIQVDFSKRGKELYYLRKERRAEQALFRKEVRIQEVLKKAAEVKN